LRDLVELLLALLEDALDDGDVLLEALDFDFLVHQLDEALSLSLSYLNDELHQQLFIDLVVLDFPLEGFTCCRFELLGQLVPRVHLGHASFVDFRGLPNLGIDIERLVLLPKSFFLPIHILLQYFLANCSLLDLSASLNLVEFLLLVGFDGLFELCEPLLEDLFFVAIHRNDKMISYEKRFVISNK
jgi:hypothetical protein